MKKKGFTLIELLAVIVILAIIALIATPTILGVIEKARKGSAESSALGYIDAVEKQIAIDMLTDEKIIDLTDETITVGTDDSGLTVKGTKPESGSTLVVNQETGIIESGTLYITLGGKTYEVEYNGATGKATVKGSSSSDDETKEETLTGPTKELPTNGETYKAIVYLDPTDLTKYCNASNSVSTTETKTGCMKWYVFDDNGDNYTMILDHNTTARIIWNDDNINVAYESSNLKAVVDDLVASSGWKVTPRLITADEVNTIVGGVSTWDVSDYSMWFFFEGTGDKNQTMPTYDSSNRSSYDWLYNNLNKCKSDSTDYGCTIEDGNTYTGYGTAGEGQTWAYWTSTPVGTAGSGSRVWLVDRSGYFYNFNANSATYGVRPVISVSKSRIS